jgi:hypothetical protein
MVLNPLGRKNLPKHRIKKLTDGGDRNAFRHAFSNGAVTKSVRMPLGGGKCGFAAHDADVAAARCPIEAGQRLAPPRITRV